jgi:hypothetical protein
MDVPGGVGVDPQHGAIFEPPAGVPVLHQTVTPRVVDDPDRREVKDGCDLVWVDPYLGRRMAPPLPSSAAGPP